VEPSNNTIVFLTKKFKEFYDLERDHKARMEEARELKEQWEEALLSKMLEEEVQNIKTGDGMFYSREDTFANYDHARESEVFDWLHETGNETLIRETINARTLTAWVKEQQEQGTDLPDFFNIATKRRIGLRK
jgi:hypothetical protein